MVVFRLIVTLAFLSWLFCIICLCLLVSNILQIDFKPHSSVFSYGESATIDLKIKYPGNYVFYVLADSKEGFSPSSSVIIDPNFIQAKSFEVEKRKLFLKYQDENKVKFPVGIARMPVGEFSFELNYEEMDPFFDGDSDLILNVELDVDSHLREYGSRSYLAVFSLISSLLGSFFLVSLLFLRRERIKNA